MAKKNSVKENVKKTSEEEKLQELESGVNAEELENASEKDIKKALTESISFTGTQKEITMNENESVEHIKEKLDKELLKLLNKLDELRIDSNKESKYDRLLVLIPDSELKNLELFSKREQIIPGEGLKIFICNDYNSFDESRFHIDLFEYKNPSYGGTDIGVRTETLSGYISIGKSPLPVNDPSVYKSFDIYILGSDEKERLNNKFFLYANKDIIIEKTIEACKQRQEELHQKKEKELEEKQKYENNVNDIAGSLGLTENHSTAKEKKLSFTDDIDKMWDFATISKNDFLMSYSYVSEKEYDATAVELKNKNLSAFQVVENLLEKGEKFSAEEAEMSYIADKIVQQAYESSASGFNVYLGFDEIANLIGKDVQWITDHLDELAEELETHNDELLLDFNGEDNIDFKEEEFDFNFCSFGEDANILFKKCDDGRWIRKTDEELQHELNEEERFVNENIPQTADSNVPVARAYSTDTNDVEAFSLILDELLSKQQFTTGSVAVNKSELLDNIRNSASDILEYCEYNNIQFYSGTDSKLYCLDTSEDYNGEPIECNTLYDVFSEAKDSADAAEYYQYDVYTPESFERIETVFNSLEMLKENQKIEIQIPGITQEDIDICAGYDIDFSKKENQQTLLELKNIFINTLDKFPDTKVSDLENAVYHCTEESRWSDLGKLLAQDSDNSIRFMFAENMIKHVTSESHDDNLSPKTTAEKGIEDIIKEEVNLDPVSMAGEKFIFELQKNITSYKNNPWVTTKIILDELKKNDPEEYKNVNLFFKKKKLKSKADYENFFEQSIGSRKVCSISTEKREPEISKNKPGKEDPDYTR